MVSTWSRVSCPAALTALILSAPLPGTGGPASVAHPLHTTLTELAVEGGSGTVIITVRLFTEDFANAVGHQAGMTISGGPAAVVPDSLALGYLRARLLLSDRAGRPITLSWGGSRHQADVSFVTLTATASDGLAGVRLVNTVHCEIFPDQVNIVKAIYDGRTETMLFTRGDSPKRLP